MSYPVRVRGFDGDWPFPHGETWIQQNNPEMWDWLAKIPTGDWRLEEGQSEYDMPPWKATLYIVFENQPDAVLYRLRWS